MAYTKYSLTPANNNAAPPNGAPEGMLPSAVNDTMRDMMAQIRDVGDGIRGGTYTMTAPVITGGSITGVALSGNTLTNPVITGGSINNTTVGATTANTGAFTTLTASSTATLNTLVSSGATITGGTISGVSLSATSPNFTTPVLGTPTSGTLTNCTGLPVATGVSGLGANVATFLATPSSANLATAVSDETGSGALVFATSPALTTPNLGTPSAATLTNATGLPVATGISGLGTGVASFLATPSSANLRTAVTDETGSGSLVFATSPTLVTPVLGVATATSVQGIIGNVTPAAGTFTSLTANGNATLGDAAGDTTTVPDLKALQVTSADRHSVRPSLLLDFANTKTLDPRITFTRASTGTYYDGKTVAKAEENLFTRSQEFDNADWVKLGSTVTANTSVAPDGTTTAETVTGDGTSGVHGVRQNLSTSSVGKTISVFAKVGTANFMQIFFDADATPFANFDLSTGVLGTFGSGVTSSITSFGNGWYRCVCTTTSTTATNPNIVMSNSASASRFPSYTGSDTLLVWGAQAENRSTVTAYTVTTTAAITNYIPALQTAAAGVARFEHNPVTGESLGLEIEEQRTNLVLYSSQFDDASWVKTQTTIDANTIIAPDGTLTGEKLVENTATNNHYFEQTVTVVSGTTYTASIYIKPAGRNIVRLYYNTAGFGSTVFIEVNLSTQAITQSVSGTGAITGSSITSVGNGWFRLTVSGSQTTSTSGRITLLLCNTASGVSYTGDGFSGAYIWGAQLEAGAFATSYIPTVASQVTRSADSASMTGTNFSSWYRADEGTLYGEVALVGGTNGVSSYISFLSDGSTSNRITLGFYNNGVSNFSGADVFVGGSSQASINAVLGLSPNVTSKNVITYARNDFGFSKDAATVITDTSGNIPVISTLHIGQRVGNNDFLNGSIKKLAYYPKRLTNAELQGVTTV